MPAFEPRRYAISYEETIDLPDNVVVSQQTSLATIPVYNAAWIECHFIVSDSMVQIDVIPDSAAGNMISHSEPYAVGESSYWTIVHGVPPYVDTSKGSHTVNIRATPVIPGDNPKVSGYVVLHGYRRD